MAPEDDDVGADHGREPLPYEPHDAQDEDES